MVSGDQEAIIALFRQVGEVTLKITGGVPIEFDRGLSGRRGSQDKKRSKSFYYSNLGYAKEGIDILTMKVEREPLETENSLELILNTLCRAFSMKPKQAAALLTNNN